MDKGTILKVTSALVGLALVLFGGWLTLSEEAEHSELLIWAGLGLIGGGLGTAALPSAIPGRPPAPPADGPRSRPRRGTTPPLAVLLALALVTGLASGCAQTAGVVGAVGVAAKVRDVTAIGARLGCRGADRLSRATGGPWVVPRSDSERAEDAAAGWFGEVGTLTTSGGEVPPPDVAPPETAPLPETGPPEPVAPIVAPPVPPPEG